MAKKKSKGEGSPNDTKYHDPIRGDFDRRIAAAISAFAKQRRSRGVKHFGPGLHRTGSSQDVHGRGRETRVGITSQRPKGEPGNKPSREVFRDMARFEKELQEIPGVSEVTVRPGVGVWEGNQEPTWVVSYKGNGKAIELIARRGQGYNQDAVFLLSRHTLPGGQKTKITEMIFPSTTGAMRIRVQKEFQEHGFSGGTWRRERGKSIYMTAAIPHWGGDAKSLITAATKIHSSLSAGGGKIELRVHSLNVTVMENNNGQYGYGQYFGDK